MENSKESLKHQSKEEAKNIAEEKNKKGKEELALEKFKNPTSTSSTPGIKKLNLVDAIKEAELIADYVMKSETFGKVFEKRDKDGKVVKNKSDIIAAIITGRELGLSEMASITFGKQLDRHAFFKVMKGASLGIDPITSLDVINVISTSNGDIIHTGINVIASALLKSGIRFEFTEDAKKEYVYCRTKDGEEVGAELKDKYFVITPKTTKEAIKKATEKGDIFVYKKLKDIKTTVRLERDGHPPLVLTYTRNQAIDAGLYKGTKSDGTTSDGKPNWNNHLETMLRNRALTIAGRLYGADVLQRTYSHEEAQEITDIEGEVVDNYDLQTNVDQDTKTDISQ